MRAIFFDTGPIISLTTNNLLGILQPLKKKYGGDFFITKGVQKELIKRPLETKRFKFEALQVLRKIEEKVIEVYENNQLDAKTLHLLDLANTIFSAKGNNITIIQYAEMHALAAAILNQADAYVVDERTTRQLIEDPKKLVKRLGRKLHTGITVDQEKLKDFTKHTKDVKVIRSVELVAMAYELGLLEQYVLRIPNPKKTLIDSVLWALKMQGCSVSEREIREIVKMES